MGLGSTYLGAFTAIIPTLPMFFSTWETYHTHTLYLGYFNGPTEGLLIASLMMLASGIWGPEIWSLPIAVYLPGLAPLIGSISVADIWGPLLFVGFMIAHLPACIQNVYNARSERGQPTLPLLIEWTPMGVFTASTAIWLTSPNSHILKDNHLLLFCLIMSLVFGRMTTKIILAHLTRQAFPLWTVLLAPLVGGAALATIPALLGIDPDAFFSARIEFVYLWAYFVFASVVYGRWAHLVITSICDFLGINCLTIPRSKWVGNNGAGPVLGVTNGTVEVTANDGQPKKD
jgi:ethanolaminephosphotransferase